MPFASDRIIPLVSSPACSFVDEMRSSHRLVGDFKCRVCIGFITEKIDACKDPIDSRVDVFELRGCRLAITFGKRLRGLGYGLTPGAIAFERDLQAVCHFGLPRLCEKFHRQDFGMAKSGLDYCWTFDFGNGYGPEAAHAPATESSPMLSTAECSPMPYSRRVL